MTMSLHLTNTIDVREIIERIEELENSKLAHQEDPTGGHWSDEETQELADLTAIMQDLKGGGGDEQWRGDWYPLTLIADCHFTDYAQELVHDCYDLKGLPNFVHIDWEATAREVRMDYSQTTIDGFTYYYR
jgi:hypothetical protein